MRKFKDALHIVQSDIHAGGTTSLFPPGQFQLLTGGFYSASYLQGLIREQHIEHIDKLAIKRKGKRAVVTFNGDMIDGDHHGTHEIISGNPKVQRDIATELIDEFLTGIGFDEKKGDSLRFTMGTPAHVGQIAQEEEAIAEDFNAIPWIPAGNDTPARYLWPEVKLKINNTSFTVRHRGPGLGRRPHTTEGALYRFLRDRWTEHLLNGRSVSDWYVFSHYHQFISTGYTVPGHEQTLNGVITPSWQLRTMYGHGFGEYDQIGGIYFEVGENDCKLKYNLMEYDEVKEETA